MNFEILKTLCDFKFCDCIVGKILLTYINFVQLNFLHNLICDLVVTRIKCINKYHAYISSTTVVYCIAYSIIIIL